MLWKILLCCLLAMTANLAWSQDTPSRIEVDLFGGYNYTHGDFSGLTNDGTHNSLSGWDVSLSVRGRHWLGGTADVAGYYAKESCYGGMPSDCLILKSHAQAYLVGPEAHLPLHRFIPFVHFLLGAATVGQSARIDGQFYPGNRFQHNTSFAFSEGGGADLLLARHLALRGGLDYLHTGFIAADDQQRNVWTHTSLRIVTGVVLRF